MPCRLSVLILILVLLTACQPATLPPPVATATFPPPATPALPPPAPSPKRTSAVTATPPPLAFEVSVMFLDRKRMDAGNPPFESPVVRIASQGEDLPTFLLSQYFKGPTAAEQEQGLELVTSGFTGFDRIELKGGVAHVYLLGECKSNGATYTIAQPLIAALRRLEGIRAVKIYDALGQTEYPDGPENSIPFCLEP